MANDDPNAPKPSDPSSTAAPAGDAGGASNEPNPLDDVKKGLGLLFRAARTAVDKIPTERLEEVTGRIEHSVTTGARDVGKALQSVVGEVEKQIGKVTKKSAPPPADAAATPPSEPSGASPAPGPRVDDGYAPGTGPSRKD